MSPREHYIDRLRTVMTVTVVVAHAMMTYGGQGSWFYREYGVSRSPASIFFTLFSVTCQAFLMGFFFLLAGYFTPSSVDRKGETKFLFDRVLRLGVPVLVFGFVLAPLTVAMVSAATGSGFWPAIATLWKEKQFINGPTWFDETLLLFSFGYALWRVTAARLGRPSSTARIATPLPCASAWLLSALGVGAAALLLRQFFPVDLQFFGLWIGYFASYILLFAAGTAAWRNRWLSQLTWAQAWPWFVVTVLVWPTLPIAYAIARTRHVTVYLAGGFSWASIFYSFWEPFVAWGIISAALVWFRRSFNQPSALGSWLARRAYAVYVIHTPILVGISLFVRSWHASAFLKCGVVSVLACIASWLAADPLVRIPGVRRYV